MPLLFLFKKENAFAESTRPLLKGKYNTPLDNSYYWDYGKNTEPKWRAGPSKLRMEFYLDILQAFAKTSSESMREQSLCWPQRYDSFSISLIILELKMPFAFSTSFSTLVYLFSLDSI